MKGRRVKEGLSDKEKRNADKDVTMEIEAKLGRFQLKDDYYDDSIANILLSGPTAQIYEPGKDVNPLFFDSSINCLVRK